MKSSLYSFRFYPKRCVYAPRTKFRIVRIVGIRRYVFCAFAGDFIGCIFPVCGFAFADLRIRNSEYAAGARKAGE